MRTIKELLELMLEHQDLFHKGLCNWVYQLNYKKLITNKEYLELRLYIQRNRPFVFSSKEALRNYGTDYFWDWNHLEPRLKWINKHIKKQPS